MDTRELGWLCGGVSFLYNTDPTKSAEDLGYLYLPQEVVTKDKYDEYVSQLKPIKMSSSGIIIDDLEDDCEGGACPIRWHIEGEG